VGDVLQDPAGSGVGRSVRAGGVAHCTVDVDGRVFVVRMTDLLVLVAVGRCPGYATGRLAAVLATIPSREAAARGVGRRR